MLQLTIPSIELWNEKTEEFIHTKEYSLKLEHSLVSLSRWESKWQKAFLSKEDKTTEESIDYIRCMTITKNVDPGVYNNIPNEIIDKVVSYIKNPMTATTFVNNDHRSINKEIITSEIIYYWMVTLNIPFECQYWHLNRLITLINVCNIRNQPAKKMSRKDLFARNRLLNEERKQRLNTTG